MINVLIADDSKITRMSLKTTLKTVADDLVLVGEAEEGRMAVEMAGTLKPDVILMDIGMPIMDGITATQKIKEKYPNIHIVMLTSHESDADVLDAFKSGANSYCLKDTPPEQLVTIIRQTHGGGSWIDPRIAMVVLRQIGSEDETVSGNAPSSSDADTSDIPELPTTFSTLTDREIDVLKLLAEGQTNTQISDNLAISMNTVKTHLKNVFQKLEVEDRTAAALKALKERII